jgi:hypothetical protein
LDDDVATSPAVASRGASERDELLAAEGGGAVSAAPSDDLNPAFVDESHGLV